MAFRTDSTTLAVIKSLTYTYCLPGMTIAFFIAVRNFSLSNRFWPRPMCAAVTTPPPTLGFSPFSNSTALTNPVTFVLARLFPAAFCLAKNPNSFDSFSALQ